MHTLPQWPNTLLKISLIALPQTLDRETAPEASAITPQAIAALMSHFGTFLQFLRQRSHITQAEVAVALTRSECWLDRCTYARMESGRRAPQFEQLAALYQGLVQSGIDIGPVEREAYLLLARQKITSKGTHHQQVKAWQWDALSAQLAAFDTGV